MCRHIKTLIQTENDDCIYTPDVVVFKSDTEAPTLLPDDAWYKVDVLTCAAPNLRENPSNAMNPCAGLDSVLPSDEELKALHIRRATRILEIAAQQGVQVLILGAFGCGAFQNPPQIVTGAYKEALKCYLDAFEVIEFAVYCPPHRTEIYETFKWVLAVLKSKSGNCVLTEKCAAFYRRSREFKLQTAKQTIALQNQSNFVIIRTN